MLSNNDNSDISRNDLFVKVEVTKYEAQVFIVSCKRTELSIPDQKASTLVLIGVNSAVSFPSE